MLSIQNQPRDLTQGQKPRYRKGISFDSKGQLQIPKLEAEDKNLTKADFKILDELTQEANRLLEAKKEEQKSKFLSYQSEATRSDQDLMQKVSKLRSELKAEIHQIFKDKFDFSKYETLDDDHPAKQKYAFLSHPIFRIAVEDSKRMNFSRTREAFDKYDSNFVFSLFQIPFIPELQTPKFGWMSFEKLLLENDVLKASKSRVSQRTDASKEMQSPILVGLFTESHYGDNNPNSYTTYILDRFVTRFKDFTLKLIQPIQTLIENTGDMFGRVRSFVEKGTFETLKKISDAAIMLASGRWLAKHEEFHRTGELPKVNSNAEDPNKPRTKARTLADIAFFLKNGFETSAWEELRVDILALLDFENNQDKLSSDDLNQIREFVLAERTIRYATEHDVNDEFDAVVSQVLLNWFVDKGAIDKEKLYKDHVLDMSDSAKVTEALAAFRDEMKRIEDEIAADFKASIARNEKGIKDILKDTSLNDAAFKEKIEALPIMEDSKSKIRSFIRYWANWHEDLRDIKAPKILEKQGGDIHKYKQKTGIDAYANIWAPHLTEKSKPERIPEELRIRKDRYNAVHPFYSSLRNLKYHLDSSAALAS